jgi:hypothetical protein
MFYKFIAEIISNYKIKFLYFVILFRLKNEN